LDPWRTRSAVTRLDAESSGRERLARRGRVVHPGSIVHAGSVGAAGQDGELDHEASAARRAGVEVDVAAVGARDLADDGQP